MLKPRQLKTGQAAHNDIEQALDQSLKRVRERARSAYNVCRLPIRQLVSLVAAGLLLVAGVGYLAGTIAPFAVDWSDPLPHQLGPFQPCPWFKDALQQPHPAIPRILHQTAKNVSDLPPMWLHNQATWRRNHPSWEYHLWSDDENLQLVEEHFPWFLSTFQSFKNPIMRVDCARYMYMYVYGGVYVDMDVESLKPLDPLLKGHHAVLAAMGMDLSFSDAVPNAFLASAPGHPFWLQLLWRIQLKANAWLARNGNWVKVEAATGPAMLHAVLDSVYPNSTGCMDRAVRGHSVHLLPPDKVFPFDWHDHGLPARRVCLVENVATFDPETCKKFYPDAYCISYWSHSWEPNMIQ